MGQKLRRWTGEEEKILLELKRHGKPTVVIAKVLRR
jgi:hypothetical protein